MNKINSRLNFEDLGDCVFEILGIDSVHCTFSVLPNFQQQ